MKEEFYTLYYELEDKHWWFIGRRQTFIQLLDRYLPAPPDGRARKILDFGCGTGTFLGYLARYGDAQGVDVDEQAIDYCHKRGVHNVQLVSGFPLPFEDNSFDLVTILDVLEHIEDDKGTLNELLRVLRPGGMLMVAVPAYRFLWGPQDEISNHKRRYIAPQMRRLLKKSGFRVRRLSYFNTFLFPAIALVRVLRPYLPRQFQVQSDCTVTKMGPLNRVLGGIFALEAPLVRRVSLPFGVSIVGLAHKPVRTSTTADETPAEGQPEQMDVQVESEPVAV
jgi:SAM-dependent methyltransferase